MDHCLSSLENALRTVSGASLGSRPTPRPWPEDAAAPGAASRRADGQEGADAGASDEDRRLSAALMRVNHVGEVCAQALYQAQALTARSPRMRQLMLAAAREETDHLAWTQERLRELNSRPSLLNPLWYAGSFAIGWVAGRLGDARWKRTSPATWAACPRQIWRLAPSWSR